MSALLLLVASFGLMQVSPVSSTSTLLPYAISTTTCPSGEHWDGRECVPNTPTPPRTTTAAQTKNIITSISTPTITTKPIVTVTPPQAPLSTTSISISKISIKTNVVTSTTSTSTSTRTSPSTATKTSTTSTTSAQTCTNWDRCPTTVSQTWSTTLSKPTYTITEYDSGMASISAPSAPPWTPSSSNSDPQTANAYNWYKSTDRYDYGPNFHYRYVFYSSPYYYYVQDTIGDLDSQVQTLQTQLQASQSDRDQAQAQAQQLSAQVEALNQQVNDLNTQMNSMSTQYAGQVSNLQNNNQALQSQASNLQNSNQALQANLDAMRTQNIIMLVIVVLLGAAVAIAVLMKRRVSSFPAQSQPPVGSQPADQSGMAFCTKCGRQVSLDASFCRICGSAQK